MWGLGLPAHRVHRSAVPEDPRAHPRWRAGRGAAKDRPRQRRAAVWVRDRV